MLKAPELTIAYIGKKPAAAARVLASIEIEDAAAFLQAIPTRFAAKTVAYMSPQVASKIFEAMEATSGGALIRDLGFVEASTILRQIEAGKRDPLLAGLSDRQKRDFEMSLAFPRDTVGAHMTTFVATLTENDSASTALDLIRHTEREHADVMFLVDDTRRLLGAISVVDLLRHPRLTSLGDLADTSCARLAAQARLETIASLDAWHDYSRLPVVTRRGKLLGTLSRKALRGTRLGRSPENDRGRGNIVELVASALGASVIGLLELLAPPGSDDAPHGGGYER